MSLDIMPILLTSQSPRKVMSTLAKGLYQRLEALDINVQAKLSRVLKFLDSADWKQAALLLESIMITVKKTDPLAYQDLLADSLSAQRSLWGIGRLAIAILAAIQVALSVFL